MSLSLYIHYPFCTNLCDYCDFYKNKYNRKLEDEYLKALEIELSLAGKEIDPEQRIINTIYIGGGTPSLVNLKSLRHVFDNLKTLFHIRPEVEFSLEINPESIGKEKLSALKDIGVNRPVFGIQSLDHRLLKAVNRKHKNEEAYRAIYLARALGFENFGIDMIFGLPRQSGKLLSDDLNQLLTLEPPHISYYQLTVEKNTPLQKKISAGKIKMPDDELMAAMYIAINEELRKNNYFRYEVSSFARPGYECRHNLNYWEGGDFLGLGPAAHSFIGNRRFANSDNLKQYLEKIRNGQRPLVYDADNRQNRITETIMLSLRTTRGLSKRAFKKRFHSRLAENVNQAILDHCKEEKLIKETDKSVRLTETGILVADKIIEKLLS